MKYLTLSFLILLLLPSPAYQTTTSKLTLHVGSVAGVDAAVSTFLSSTFPRVLKLLDPKLGSDAAALHASPDTVLCGRVWTPTQPTDNNPHTAAAVWLSSALPFIVSNPLIQYWEGYNELPGTASNRSLMQWYAAFEVERVQLLSARGLRAVVGSFATSDFADLDPITSTFTEFVPAVYAAAAAGGWLSLHEYSSPLMSTCFDNATGTGHETGRYRTLYANFFAASNPPPPPLFLSEVGVGWSPISCGGTNAVLGWRAYCAAWNAPGGPFPGMSCEDAYVKQLAWYDSLLRADDFVVGAAIFCQDCGGFDSFDTGPALGALARYMG
jgi:hypothetical protein